MVFGRYSIAIVTPFIDYEINPSQPIDEIGLESVISHVSVGLHAARRQLEEQGRDPNIIGG